MQNKMLEYNGPDNVSKAPDNYLVSIPGVGQNDFWNSNSNMSGGTTASPVPPSFVLTENKPWKIEYEKKTFEIGQEVSRINEFTYGIDGTSVLNGTNNMAAAIAFYPYVRNQKYNCLVQDPQDPTFSGPTGPACCVDYLDLGAIALPSPYTVPSPNLTAKYEDYAKFTITTEDGTQYIFGRPLRGQKYLFSEEPFWSTMASTALISFDMVYNELWKTDFVAEWLLTEVRSNDYFDTNGDGIANNGDSGDWIRIDYTHPVKYENLPGLPSAIPEPRHREFLNLTQTDRASSIWRERAYVTKITTPIQSVDFTSTQRFDVNHDYFNMPFNRINDNYVYQDRNVSFGSTGGWAGSYWGIDPITGADMAPELIDAHTIVNYPVELKKYTEINVRENINLSTVQNVKLNYAGKGSAQELAVSHYLILENDGNSFTTYDPATLGGSLSPSLFYKSEGRGKTTLLGIDYRGIDPTSTNKISYTFNYENNIPYDEIHKYQIYKQAAYPTIREALRSPEQRWTGEKTIPTIPQTYISNSCSPYKMLYVDCFSAAHEPSGPDYDRPVFEDEFGYYYDASSTDLLKGRSAWSLTGINLPYGGNIKLTYDRDNFDAYNDRIKWIQGNSFADYCIPPVGHYNNVANLRNLYQSYENEHGDSHPYIPEVRTKLDNEFYFMMNSLSGGLRVKKIDIVDNFGAPTVTKNFAYGTGHYTIPPADYISNYLSAFGAFTEQERERHMTSQKFSVIAPHSPGAYSDYNRSMSPLMADVRVDKSIRDQGVHYYEFIDEGSSDGSKIRRYYGKLHGNMTNPTPGQVGNFHLRNGVLKEFVVGGGNPSSNMSCLLSVENDNEYKIGNYKTEYYNALSQIVKSTQTDYDFAELFSSTISTAPFTPLERYYKTFTENPPPISTPPSDLELIPLESAISEVNLYEIGFPYSTLSLMKYYTLITPPAPGTVPIVSTTMEAQNPMSKIGAEAGNYSGMPSWFAPVLALPDTWTSPGDAATVNSAISYFIGHAFIPSFFFKDNNMLIEGVVQKSQQSYKLFPTVTRTITNFY